MKVKEAIRLIEAGGWILKRVQGSHRVYKHPAKKGHVIIAGKPSEDLDKGTYNNILKQGG